LEEKSQLLFSGLERAAHKAGLSVVINRVGSMGSIFFTEEEVKDFASAKQSDCEKFKKFYSGMLEQGVYLAPSPFEAWFVSAAHDSEVIKMTIECAERSFASLGS